MSWLSQGIIYQIFPERFAIGRGYSILSKMEMGLYDQNAISRDWDHQPVRYEETPYEFLGGDLWGLLERLDYIQSLGTSIIYLTPFLLSPTNHKYDAMDFKTIDPAMGDDDVLAEILKEMHSRGMYLIIDLALNHVSDRHPYFQEAITNPDSPYCDYFRFIEYPYTYECWTGHIRMPELNFRNVAVQQEFITGPDSVIHYWVNKGVDGIRLDCANDLGMEVVELIQKEVKSLNPQAMLIGEVSNFAADWTRHLDSTQSYFLSHSIYSLLESRIGSSRFLRNVSDVFLSYGREKACQSFVMLSSHDSPRALDIFNFDQAILKLALILQFTLPGVPMVYYGDENGMEGGHDPRNRAGMVWDQDRWKTSLRSYYKDLIRIRNEHPELQDGEWKGLELPEYQDICAYLRFGSEKWEVSVVILNTGVQDREFRLFIPYSHLYSNMILTDLLGQGEWQVRSSFIDVKIQAKSGMILSPRFNVIPSYRFYKEKT